MYTSQPPGGVAWPLLPSGRKLALRWILQQLERTERAPREERQRAQLRQLHALLSHAATHIPFYADRLRTAGFDPSQPLTEEVWQRIPVLARKDIQQNGAQLRSQELPAGHGALSKSTTSGSTGMPIEVVKTGLARLFFEAITIRELLWQRRDLSQPWHSIRFFRDGKAPYPDGAVSDSWGHSASVLGKTGPGFGLHIDTDVADQLRWLQAQQPVYLMTYPSNLRALLDQAQAEGIELPGLRQVITISESVSPLLRDACRSQWGVPIADLYSAQEVGYIALQAPQGDHYLVPDEVVRVDLLDDDGQPVSVGESGRVVVTSLHNYAMPLLRYEIGDYAERGGDSPCGRTLPVLNRILGRVRHMLSYPDGRTKWPLFSVQRFRDVVDVRQFRIIQRELDLLEFQVTVARPLRAEEKRALAEAVVMHLEHPFRVEVTEHAVLERSKSGKFEDFRNELLSQ